MIPLKPGIIAVNPSSVRTGDTISIHVTGYNSNYLKASPTMRAWLKMDDEKALAVKSITIKDDRNMALEFTIPEYLPTQDRVKDFSLVLDSAVDGTTVLPNALFVTQDSIDPEMGQKIWENASLNDLNNESRLSFPFRNILSESIRNTYFHVPLWFSMLFLFLASVINGIGFLRSGNLDFDNRAQGQTKAGILFGILGLLTGAIWAKNTWGAYWSWDIKQNMTAIALLIYFAYFVLRASFEDPEKKARLSSVYSIFAFATLIPLLYVIPRLTDSLHPGSGGNPAFGSQDLDNTMRMIFYPAIIGWTLLGFWIAQLAHRVNRIQIHLLKMNNR